MAKKLDLHGQKATRIFPKLDSALEEIDANLTGIADLSPLAALKKLRVLKLRGTKVESLEPILGCRALAFLYLEKSRIASLEGIGRLRKLELLWLHDTAVTDGAPLAELSALENLDLAGVPLDDFSFLSQLQSLETLDLYGTSFADAALLETLPELTAVRLTRTKVKRTSPAVARLAKTLSGRGGGVSFDTSSSWRSRLAMAAARAAAAATAAAARKKPSAPAPRAKGPSIYAVGAGKHVAIVAKGSSVLTLSLQKQGARGYRMRVVQSRLRDPAAAAAAASTRAAEWAKRSTRPLDATARRMLLNRIRITTG
jgi:hypothetical protein